MWRKLDFFNQYIFKQIILKPKNHSQSNYESLYIYLTEPFWVKFFLTRFITSVNMHYSACNNIYCSGDTVS